MRNKIKSIAVLLKSIFIKIPIDVVYLYGSHATSQNDSLSDYDFGILFSENLSGKKRFEERLSLFGTIANALEKNEDEIDAVDLMEVPLLLQFNVICGKTIYIKDEKRRISFESYIMARYHDEHYYLDRSLFETLAKIRKGVYFERPIPYA